MPSGVILMFFIPFYI